MLFVSLGHSCINFRILHNFLQFFLITVRIHTYSFTLEIFPSYKASDTKQKEKNL